MSTNAKVTGKKGKRASLIGGIILIILGVLLLACGMTIAVLNQGTDNDGYATSNVYQIRTPAYAFALEMGPLQIVTPYGHVGQVLFGNSGIAQAKWIVRPIETSRQLFAGYATPTQGRDYLNRFETAAVISGNFKYTPYYPSLDYFPLQVFGAGLGGPARPPVAEGFWLERARSSTVFSLDYDPIAGGWLVVMNSDGTPGVEADIQLAFKVPVFTWLAYLLIPLGILLCILGVWLMRRRRSGAKI